MAAININKYPATVSALTWCFHFLLRRSEAKANFNTILEKLKTNTSNFLDLEQALVMVEK